MFTFDLTSHICYFETRVSGSPRWPQTGSVTSGMILKTTPIWPSTFFVSFLLGVLQLFPMYIFIYLLFVYYFVVLGMKPGASQRLGSYPTKLLTPNLQILHCDASWTYRAE